MKPLYMMALFFLILIAAFPAYATTDGTYSLNKNLTASWDGTTASRLNSATADYDYTYGDESAVTYMLPWQFTFYGQSYSQITADTNGNVWFGTTGSANSFNLASNGKGPVIAAWNNDLSSYFTGGVFVQHKTNPERVVIEWQTETYSDEGSALPNDFEVVLFPNGDIRLDYNSFTAANIMDYGSGISSNDNIHYLSLTTAFLPVYQLAGGSYTFSTQGVAIGVPDAPTGAKVISGNGQATVSFNAPASNGGGTITVYTVTASPGGQTATGSSSPITVTGLINGTAYTFAVTATNSLGTGPASSTQGVVIGFPGAPTGVMAIAGNVQATVSFNAPASNGGGTINAYTVTTNPGGKTATGSSSPIIVTGLSNGTVYNFTVTASNIVGSSLPSAPSNSVTPASTVPNAPTGVVAVSGNGQASVSFTAPAANGGSAITGYTVTSSPGNITATGTASPIIVTGLTNGTAYTFTVSASNATGTSSTSAPSNSVTPYVSYSLALNVSGPGTIRSAPTSDINCTGVCNQSYGIGTVVTLTAIPGSGFRLGGWMGACSGTGSCNVTMSQAQNVTAIFLADTTPVQTTVSPIMGTYGATQNVTLTCSSVFGSGCASTYYCLGNGCTPTSVYSGPISIASSTLLRFYSTDVAGNSEQVRTYSYTVDPTLTYSFERLWPQQPQEWYFNNPTGVAVDANGNEYVADSNNNRIQKFDANGYFVTAWGSAGTGNGQFSAPQGITVDASGNLYVADTNNNRIQKFDSNGTFITSWGSQGSGNGLFNYPQGVAVDAVGNVYVTDTGNNLIQKFDSSGNFVITWGSQGSGNGQFKKPAGITTDPAGNVYVSDTGNNRIQKFGSSGNFVTTWGSQGSGNGQFNNPLGITVDIAGNIYVADSYNSLIQKFNSSGAFVSSWGTYGNGNGQFNYPQGVIADLAGNVYVADSNNNRIQKFDSGNNFVTAWGSSGNGDGQFFTPSGIAGDQAANVYVADTNNNRIQKFDSLGNFVDAWGSAGSDNGLFGTPYGIAVDSTGNVYVADTGNNRIQKFDSVGNFVNTWGTYGSGNGQFNNPIGISVDFAGNVYVADTNNNQIQKFDSNGNFVATWGSQGSANGLFNAPYGITVDSAGNVYVTDSGNNRIQKFDSNGNFVTTWGSQGSVNGQFNFPQGITVDSTGNVYVVDSSNNRVQKFDSSGTFITAWGSNGTGNGQFTAPQGITVDSAGNVYIADTGNNRIQKFNSDVPTGVTATAGYGQAIVSFLAPTSNSASAITGYTVTSSPGNITVTGTASPIIVTGLSYGTAYTFTVTASNIVGSSLPSAPSNSVTLAPPTTLAAPTGVVAVSGNGQATVSFTAPAFNAITGYTVTSSPGNITATGTASPIIVTGLTNGTAYTFTVSASNAFCTSSTSAPSNSVTPDSIYSLALNVSGPGTIHSAPTPDINCTGVCNQSYGIGTVVTLTAIPGNGFRLGSWMGACSGTGTCNVTMNQAQNVTAIFVADTTPVQTTVSPVMGIYGATQNVTLTCSNVFGSGCASTYYCLGNGCTPTSVYSGPISIASSTSLRFYSTDEAGNSEQVRTYSYTIDPTLAYSFERLWPNQQWYFNNPSGVAVDANGNVYVVDSKNNRIQKFDSNGYFVTEWGSYGNGNGQFSYPQGVTVDTTGNVYVADTRNQRIQKFDSNGNFITWGPKGGGNWVFSYPQGITADSAGNVYVVDSMNNRIQKFDSSGDLITTWGWYGSGNGAFNYPVGITTDSAGNVYVSDSGNYRIQKFSSSGKFVTTWGSQGSGHGQFITLVGITTDSAGNVYVSDTGNYCIQKFNSSGAFVSSWGSYGNGNGQFNNPQGVTADLAGNIYVADSNNNRIQKFDSGNNFVTAWGSSGSGNGQFSTPSGIAGDHAANVYVTDTNNSRIQKFDSNGNFVTTWGSQGSANGLFNFPQGITVDSTGNVYVADTRNNRIQKFDSSGNFVTSWGSDVLYGPSGITVDSAGNIYVANASSCQIQKFDSDGNFVTYWGSFGNGNGQFISPQGITADLAGNVYVADTSNNRIQKFDSNGNFVTTWGSQGSANGLFNSPQGIAVDSTGNVYVVDSSNNRVQKFDSSGTFITAWGSNGTGNGQFNAPQGITVDSAGNVYIADTGNNRIQKFDPILFSTPAVPGAPTVVTAVAGNGQVTVSFNAPATNGGSAITGYTVTSGPGNITATGTASPIIVNGLSNGTAYTFTVVATNSVGTGPASAPSNSVSPVPTTPGAPTVVVAISGNGQATVSFNAPASNGGSAITGYSVTSSPGNITATGMASPIIVTGLSNGTAYTFTVTASNIVGSSLSSVPSNSVTPNVVTIPPALTVNPVTSPTTTSFLTLTGTIGTGASLNVSANTSATIGPISIGAGTWSCTVSNLPPGLNTFTITAFNQATNSTTINVSVTYTPPLTITLSSTSIADDYQGSVGITVSNIPTAGGEILIEQLVDVNGSGVIADNDYVIRSFKVTDGTVSANPNVQGDEDGTANSIVKTTLGYFLTDDIYHAPGEYIFRVTQGTTTGTTSFKVTPVSQLQTVSGIVTDGANPVAGALVQLIDKWQRHVTWAIADATGTYVLNIKQPGNYNLLPLAYGYVATAIPVTLTAGQSIENQSLTLTAGTYNVTGQLKDLASGTGITGVWILATGTTNTKGVAMTNSSGAYDLLLPTDQYTVTALEGTYLPGAFAQGYTGFKNLPVNITVSGTSSLPDITLTAGSILAGGQVLDSTGTPVPGIPVEASISGAIDIRQPTSLGISNATGAYSLGLFTAANWNISLGNNTAQTLGYLGTNYNNLSITVPTNGNNLTVYPITAWVQGTVMDSTNKPLPGVEVNLRNTNSTITASVFTASDGTYLIGAFAGNWYIDALTGAVGDPAVPEQDITLVDTQIATINFVSDLAPPMVSITSPASGITGNNQPLLTYTVNEGTVVVKVDGTIVNKLSGDTLDLLANGQHTVQVEATDTYNTMVSAEVTFTVSYTPPSITSSSLPYGITGNSYNQLLMASGGLSPYTWSITTGTLPTGLSLNPSTGTISGTATTTGTANFTVQVLDTDKTIATANLSITIYSPLSINTGNLVFGYVGTAYSQTISATGGLMPYKWSVSSGSLPAGLSLNASSGTITGTPTTTGTSTFTVQVTDANGTVATTSLTITLIGTFAVSTSSLSGSDIGSVYSQTLAATGGMTPYTWSISSGSLSAGLSLNVSTGAITGTPTTAGTSNFTVQVQDGNSATANKNLSIVVSAQLSISTSSLPGSDIGSAYSQTLAATGGMTPYAWSITSGSLPAGLSMNASTGAITGTPTTAGTSTFTVQVQDGNSATANKNLSIVVSAQPSISTSSLPGSDIGSAYSQNLTATGGITPYTWSISSGSLPSGLSMNASTGAITGIPTTAGTSTFTVQVQDGNSATANKNLSIVVSAQLSISMSSLPGSDIGNAYSQNLTATGGMTPYTWSISSGSLSAGLSLNASTGAITGTPTTAGTSTFTVQVRDSNSATANKNLSIVVSAQLSISTSSLPGGSVGYAYSQTLAATGGMTPYTWSISSGSLPSGLSMNASTGAITGTPTTAGTSTFTVQVQDGNSVTANKNLSIVVSAQLSISTSSLPGGSVGYAYSQTLAATGGLMPYSWSVTSGSLPTGFSLNTSTGTITGTPTATGSSTFTVKVTDSNSVTATQSLTITISGPLTVTTTSLPGGTIGTYYNQPLAATGGKTPYNWSIASGSIPAGLTQNSATGAIIGTPTTTGTSTFTVQVTDANSTVATQSLTITIFAPLSITTTSAPWGTVSTSYNVTMAATGGLTPYTWSISSGSLPAGLSMNASTGAITGTPTTVGSSTFTVQVTDSNSVTAAKSLTIVIYAPLSITTTSLPGGTNGTNYNQPLAATGGKTPYNWSIASGSIPAGLTQNSATGAIIGTPTATGTSTFTVQVTDANGSVATQSLTITISAPLSITTTSASWGTVGASYNVTMAATGGLPPYTWSISSGSLPAGLSLNASSGTIAGTPTTVGSSTFTVQVTDSNSVSATKSLTITIYAPLSITTTSLPGGITGTYYNQPLAATGGKTSYNWSIASGNLPAGLSINANTGSIMGTPTATGTSTFTVQVTDANSTVATQSLTITIFAPLSIATTSAPWGTVGTSYNVTMVATGGLTPYTWSISSGSLPAGLSLNASTGTITGTPTTVGSSTFTVQVKDSNSVTATKSLTITIYAPLSITTTSLPGGTTGTYYNQPLAATGGKTPYNWSIASGSLPVGLSINVNTGSIMGTPTATGTSTFTVQVTDANGTVATKSLSISIAAH